MEIEIEFVVKVKTQVMPDQFRCESRIPYRGEVDRGIGEVSRLSEMEHFRFAVFYSKSRVEKKFGDDIITIEKKRRR